MPTVPGNRFIDRPANVSTPTLAPVQGSLGPAAQMGEAFRGLSNAGFGLSHDLLAAQIELDKIQNATVVQDSFTGFHERSRKYAEGVREFSGANAIGLTQKAEEVIGQDFQNTLDSLPTEGMKKMFKAHAFSSKESFISSVASHEYNQLEKYRTDTVTGAYLSSHEDIKLSNGDPKLVENIISGFESRMAEMYPGQDVSTMKQQYRARLEAAGREAQNRYAQTSAFDIVRGKFTKPDAAGNPEMDYIAAKNYLLDNPDKLPQISQLTIEQREQLSNIIWSDGVRAKQQKKEAQADVAGTMWSSYDKLLRNVPMNPDEPQTIQEWHSRAEQYTQNGQMDESVLKTAISFTKAEQLQAKQEKAAIELQGRQEKAAQSLEEDRARRLDPLNMSNLKTKADIVSRVTSDPASVPVSEIIGLVGKGLSIQDAQEITTMVKGAPAKLWSSPTGLVVKRVLNDYRRNYAFDNADSKNDSGYSEAITHFQKWLQVHPDATADEADKEMRVFMYPYKRGWFGRQWDATTGNAPILDKGGR